MTTTGDDLPPRSGKGRWVKGVDSYERDAEACRLYTFEGYTFQRVSDELGYGGKQNAHRAIQRTLLETIKAPAEELRAREVLRAEEIYLMSREIARDRQPLHSGGKLVYGEDGKPLIDHGLRLSAMDRMRGAMERLAKLKGLDSPVKVGMLTLEEIQALIAAEEAEIARMAAEGESQ